MFRFFAFTKKLYRKVEVHFQSEVRTWEESLVKWHREHQARELQHSVDSEEQHNRSRCQQEAAHKPQ